MGSLSMVIPSSAPPIQNHLKTLKPKTPNSLSLPLSYNSFQNNPSLLKNFSFLQTLSKTTLPFTTIQFLSSFPSLASETVVSSSEQVSDKINLDSILVSIDDFFNKNPFFVAGCTFIWLVVIPLTEEYLRKYKFISAIDAFRKLRDTPEAQLLDIRKRKSTFSLRPPNLKLLNKSTAQVEFSEEDEDGFVKSVLEKFSDPSSTILCVLDNFDGNSMRAAELLFKNGFKEAYAIRGGVRGKKGWLAIQETLLPPSVHISPRKKTKISKKGMNGGVNQQIEDKISFSSGGHTGESQGTDNGHASKSTNSTPQIKIGPRSSSPYPNYPDMKPPSSPTPSKP